MSGREFPPPSPLYKRSSSGFRGEDSPPGAAKPSPIFPPPPPRPFSFIEKGGGASVHGQYNYGKRLIVVASVVQRNHRTKYFKHERMQSEQRRWIELLHRMSFAATGGNEIES